MYPFMTRVLLPEEGGNQDFKMSGYLIEFPDLPGCMSDGETLEDAIENGKDALQCWIEAAAEDGQEIPEPGSHVADVGSTGSHRCSYTTLETCNGRRHESL